MAPYRKMTQKQIRLEQRPWITQGLLVSMKKRDKLSKQRAREKDPQTRNEISEKYKHYRNMIVTLLKMSKKIYYSAFFLQNQGNVKKTWDGIRALINVSKKKGIIPTKIVYKDEIKTSSIDIAESLNDSFVSIGSTLEGKIPKSKKTFFSYLGNFNNKSIFLKPCTHTEVLTIIKCMKTSKACGPNSIPTNFLIEFSESLVGPLESIINMSLKEGIFPNINKEADVRPSYKKGDKTRCDNYRPISLLSNISKIFERIMYSRLEDFLKSSDVLYKFQFCFRKQYSTNHALLSIVENIRSALDKNMYSCGVFIDLEKAFDTVDHRILLSKLYHYGIRGNANSWFYSYLSHRSQTVTINETTSSKKSITCGVPQGSILGPLLFLIYVNDMNHSVKSSTVYHFADDTNLLYSDKTIMKLKTALNKDLASLYDWLYANRLSLNAGKTEFIVFRPPRKKMALRITLKLHHSKLYESSKIKYLGLILDNKLNWKAHINELSKKLSRAIGLLYKVRNFCKTSTIRSLYFSLFNSHLSYGLVVWGNANISDINKIKSLQKRAIHAISEQPDNTDHIFFEQNILNIDDQLKVQMSSLMWEYDHNTLPSSLRDLFKRTNLVHNYSTRGSNKGNLFHEKVNTTKYGINSFKYQGIKIINNLKKLPIYQNTHVKSKFLKQLKTYLLSEYVQ